MTETYCQGKVITLWGREIVVCPDFPNRHCLARQVQPVQASATTALGPQERQSPLVPTAPAILEACQNLHRR